MSAREPAARRSPATPSALALAGLAAAACSGVPPSLADVAGAHRILGPIPVSSASSYVAHTPLAVRNATVYVATLEPGPSGDRPNAGDALTVVRKGVEAAPGDWRWSAVTVDERTVADEWHNAPSVGLDETGHVHVAYNMHNLPWQYVVSAAPGDIDAFEFRGQRISQAELDRYRLENKTRFPGLGNAAIPGTQITYPAFANDPAGRLHVTYRFAAKPARPWLERTMSSGLARYDATTRTWTPLGGLLELAPGDDDGSPSHPAPPRAVASATGWTSYLPRVTFAPDGSPTVSFLWREGGAGATTVRPCAVTSDPSGLAFTAPDGTPAPSPAGPDDCPPVGDADPAARYRSIGDAAADSAGHHHLLLSPEDGPRTIHAWDGAGWIAGPAPGGAVEIFFDAADNLWAVGDGSAVHVRRADASGAAGLASSLGWDNVVPRADDGCFPHAELDADGRTAYVFELGCDAPTASVLRLDLEALLGGPIEPVGPASAGD